MTERHETDCGHDLAFNHAPHKAAQGIDGRDIPVTRCNRKGRRIGRALVRSEAAGPLDTKFRQQCEQGLAHPAVLQFKFTAFAACSKPVVQTMEFGLIVLHQRRNHSPENSAVKCGVAVLQKAEYPSGTAFLIRNRSRMDGPFEAA